MRFFFDTEFIEDGKTIDLLSIGIVADDGREYYTENSDADISKANEWVKANVIPHLSGNGKTREQIAMEIVNFVGYEPEFWADWCAYDWVAICQIFGKMMDLPPSWPMYCNEFRMKISEFGDPRVKFTGTAHNALDDARHLKKMFEALAAK